jgi:hypothetical protein
MPEHVQYEDDDLFNPETAHEHSDVPLKPLWVSLILFVVFAVVTHIVLYFMYHALVRMEEKRMDPPQTAVARPADIAVPKNQPLLQPFPRTAPGGIDIPPQRLTPVSDLVDMRAAEDKVLHSYGWVDKQKGIVRIPIDRAKDLIVAQKSGAVAASATENVPQPAGEAPAAPPTTTGGHL